MLVYLAYYWLDHGVSSAQAARNLNLLGFRYAGPPSMNSDESDQRKSDEIPWTAYHLYANWMNPLLECVEALKQREIQPV